MAFSKTPINSTYQTKAIRLFNDLDSRSSSTNYDPQYVNCFFDVIRNRTTQEKDQNIVKRAGLEVYGDALPDSSIRGIHYWEDYDKLFVAVSDDIVVYIASTGVIDTTLSAAFTTVSGDVGFTEFLYDNNVVRVVATDGTDLITITNANTVIPCTDPDLPTPHLPIPIFLDGYLFLVKEDTADIYNSNLNDPIAWTSGDVLAGEMFPDVITYIAKLNNYIVAFGSNSIEYFWDAANESGSPLQRNDTPIKLVGLLGGFAQAGNRIYFIGNMNGANASIFMLEDFKIKEVANETIRKYLESVNTSLENTESHIVSFSGHDFYLFTIGTLTYVLDLETSLWTRFAYQANLNMYIRAAINIKTSSTPCTVIHINGESQLLKFNTDIYQDDDVNFTFRVVSDNHYFDTQNQKFMSRLIVYADQPSADTNISISWSDNDYTSYSTAVTINLNQELPCTYRLGRFRRRAFKLEYTDNYPLRIKKLEADINIGQS